MKDKEYGVKLNLDITSFKASLEKAKELTEKAKENIEKPLKKVKGSKGKEKVKIDIDIDKEGIKNTIDNMASELSSKIEPLAEKYANLVQQYRDLTTPGYGELIAESDVQEAEQLKKEIQDVVTELEKLTGEKYVVKGITEPVKEAKREITGVITVFSNLGDVVSRSINKGVASIKRFSLSLLGIHGVYMLLSRASNAYMSQDEKLHTKMQANWIALGAIFAPIIEKLIAMFQRLVAYVNVFYKALTGKNLIEQALKKVEKSSTKTAKAVKELNKELANLDEITNLSFDTGTNALETPESSYGIPDALKEIENIKLNPQIVQVIQWIAEKLKDAWNWCVKLKSKLEEWGIPLNEIIRLVGVIFGATEVGRIVSSIAKIIGVSGGTAGLYGIITAMALIDAYLLNTLIKDFKELNKVIHEEEEADRNLADAQIKGMELYKQRIQEIQKQIDEGNKVDKNGNDLIQQKNALIEESQELYNSFNRNLNSGKKFTKEQVQEMDNLKKKLEKITGEKYTITIDVQQTKESKSWWEKFIIDIDKTFEKMGKVTQPGIKGAFTNNHFAKGNVAYQPTIAEFGEYAGARSNPEITAPQNMMRETLYEALSDALPLINNKGGDTILYVNGKELARATYSDFQNEKTRLGSSNVAVRRS